MGVGKRIASLRRSAQMSQDQLASVLGVTRSAVAQWETDRASPLSDKLFSLAGALHCTLDDLFSQPSEEGQPDMSFAIRNLSVLAYAQGFTLWHYETQAPMAQVCSRGFFDAAADMMAAGDMVLVSAVDGGRVLFIRNADVSSISTTTIATEAAELHLGAS
jgi:transcriptional regulator with XRE-family HTH domain